MSVVRSVLKAITIDKQRPFTQAYCDTCRSLNHQTSRESARRHADDLRHTVRFVVEQHTVYRPTGDTE